MHSIIKQLMDGVECAPMHQPLLIVDVLPNRLGKNVDIVGALVFMSYDWFKYVPTTIDSQHYSIELANKSPEGLQNPATQSGRCKRITCSTVPQRARPLMSATWLSTMMMLSPTWNRTGTH